MDGFARKTNVSHVGMKSAADINLRQPGTCSFLLKLGEINVSAAAALSLHLYLPLDGSSSPHNHIPVFWKGGLQVRRRRLEAKTRLIRALAHSAL